VYIMIVGPVQSTFSIGEVLCIVRWFFKLLIFPFQLLGLAKKSICALITLPALMLHFGVQYI